MRLGIYLAARYSRRQELIGYAGRLVALGHDITARWVSGCHEQPEKGDGHGPIPYDAEEQCRFALDDLNDVHAADLVIAFTEPPTDVHGRGRGGRHVETGIAIGLGTRLWIVGPRENVFHYLPMVRQFGTFDDLVAELR